MSTSSCPSETSPRGHDTDILESSSFPEDDREEVKSENRGEDAGKTKLRISDGRSIYEQEITYSIQTANQTGDPWQTADRRSMADSAREIDVKKQMGDPKQEAHVSAGTSQDKADVFFSGTCEVEVSEGGEVDLQKHYSSCEKNPGHQKFVPVHQFSEQHLPSDFRDDHIMNLIRAISELTVRVSVKYASERRPQTCPGSDQPYPFCGVGCKNLLRTGTGWVTMVKKMDYGFHEGGELIKTREDPYEIYIKTAAHVVYDNLEAAHTTCYLFFDQGGTPDLCPGVVTLTGMSVINTDVEKDFCEMRCVTCASDLTYRLNSAIEEYVSIEKHLCSLHRASLVTKIVNTLPSFNLEPHPLEVLTIIVSHPHGCSKQVSVGHCVSRVMEHGTVCTQLTYTTPTCPGSSGAHVFLLGNRKDDHQHVHFGTCGGKSELNHSSKGEDSFYHNLRGIAQQQILMFMSTKYFHVSSGYEHWSLMELIMMELERKGYDHVKLLELIMQELERQGYEHVKLLELEMQELERQGYNHVKLLELIMQELERQGYDHVKLLEPIMQELERKGYEHKGRLELVMGRLGRKVTGYDHMKLLDVTGSHSFMNLLIPWVTLPPKQHFKSPLNFEQDGLPLMHPMRIFERKAELMKKLELGLKIFEGKDWPKKSDFTLVNNLDPGQHHEKCPKFPVYQKLKSEDSFSTDHLICEFQDPEVKCLIRDASDLIVRVSVKYVSEDPELCHLDSNLTGTGYVLGVTTYKISCKQKARKKCQVQPKFARIYICTKVSFFSDKNDAKDISCDFFFDRGSTSNKHRNAVTFHGMPQVVRTEKDLCVVMYETHDLFLAFTLRRMIKRCKMLEAKLMPKYHDKLGEDIHHLPPCEHNLAIILSDTESTAKMRESAPSQVTCNTPTCPGSAGGQDLGSDSWEPSYVQTRASDLNTGCNHSRLVGDLDISNKIDDDDDDDGDDDDDDDDDDDGDGDGDDDDDDGDDDDDVDRLRKISEDVCHEHIITRISVAIIPCLAQFILDDKIHDITPS